MAIAVGFRFLPTDEELVTYFLFNKIFAQTDPFNDLEKFSVREGDLYGSQDPWDIWSLYGGDNLEDGQPLYFFTRLKKVSSKGSRISRRHQKPDDIVLCRMKKNPVAEKKKRKLQQVLNSEPWMSSKHSKLVEPQPVPISVQQYQQQAELKKSHNGSNILPSEAEVVDSRLMFDPDLELLFSPEEEELLLNGTILEQHLESDNISDDEPCICSKLVEPPPVPISVQQEAEFNSQHTGSNIETEPMDARSLEEEELLYSIELGQLLESDDELKAAETQEISAAESSSSTIDPADSTSLMFDPQEFLLDGFEEEEFLLYSPDQLLQGV
ncbi:hypothetical protein Q3G72_016824 [Acer saccharum]|nr:hypothetical protein Q3G72_016824 [Acer saccharum]